MQPLDFAQDDTQNRSMPRSPESDSAIQAVDDLLAGVGVVHGRRLIRRGTPRYRRQDEDLRAESPVSQTEIRRVGDVEVVHVPSWGDEHAWLRHGFSTRRGGVSTVYRREQGLGSAVGELNLGFTASDSAENVVRNREIFCSAVLGVAVPGAAAESSSNGLVTLYQIHSGLSYRIPQDSVGKTGEMKGDGLMTDQPGVLLGIQTADCIPVLIADPKRRAVAAFHAGWRGTLKRIVEGGVGRMRTEFGSKPEDLEAAIGPGIGSCCYAVGEDVRSEFESQFAYASELFSEVYDSDPVKEKYPLLFMTARAPGHSDIGPGMHLDLVEANRRQLLVAGLRMESVYASHTCTGCNADQYFSYRAEAGFCGRMMSAIGIAED